MVRFVEILIWSFGDDSGLFDYVCTSSGGDRGERRQYERVGNVAVKDGVVERRARSTRWEGGSGTIFSRDVYVCERRIDSVNHNVEGPRIQTVAMDTVFSSVTSRGTDSNKVGEYVRSSLIPKNI